MHFKLLSDRDLKAMDALLESYGGAIWGFDSKS
jgi:hypothetical protein